MNWIKLILNSIYGRFARRLPVCPPGMVAHNFETPDAVYTECGFEDGTTIRTVEFPEETTYRKFIFPERRRDHPPVLIGNARDRRRTLRRWKRGQS